MSSPAESFQLPSFYPSFQVIEGEVKLPVGDEFKVVGLAESLKTTQNNFFFDPNFSASHGITQDYMLRSSSFTLREDWAVGREDSSQQVFFGELRLVIDEGAEGREVVQPVAVKPYHIAAAPAVHEYVSFNFINDSGIIETFHPVGFWVGPEGGIFLMTEFEEAVRTLDNIDWQKTENDPLLEHFEPFGALVKSAQTLARLHAAGLSHGDAQIKNMAVDDYGLRLVDLTRMRRVRGLRPGEEFDYLVQASIQHDLRDLIHSVNNRSYLGNSDSDNRRLVIAYNLLEPYRSIMRHPSSAFAGNLAVHEVIDLVHDAILEDI